jgi:glycosyltransferase involved in cell wall biosynthesis
LQANSGHIVFFLPGFAADEFDESCLTCLQYYFLNLRKIKPEKQFSIIAFNYPKSQKNYIWNGIPIYSMGGDNRRYAGKIITWIRVLLCFHKLNKQNKVTCIQSFWLRECTLLGLLVSKFYKIPITATIQGQDAQKGNWYLKLFHFFDFPVISNSEFNASVYNQSTGKNCTHVIPFGVDYDTLYNFWPLQNSKRTTDIIGIGSLLPVKNYSLFLEIIKKVSVSFPEIKVVLIGGGPEENLLKQKISSLGLSKNVSLTGFIASRKAVLEYLNNSKLFLHTATHEGQCYAFMEAFAYGLNLVTFNVGYIPDSAKSYICKSENEMVVVLNKLLSYEANTKVEPILTMKESAALFAKNLG